MLFKFTIFTVVVLNFRIMCARFMVLLMKEEANQIVTVEEGNMVVDVHLKSDKRPFHLGTKATLIVMKFLSQRR